MSNAGGRPTKYTKDKCDQIKAAFEQGYSYTAACAEIGIALSNAQIWEQRHPAFQVAVKEGRHLAVLFWERINIENARNNGGNATSIVFGLKNRAPDEWKDISRRELTGQDGEAIETKNHWTVEYIGGDEKFDTDEELAGEP